MPVDRTGLRQVVDKAPAQALALPHPDLASRDGAAIAPDLGLRVTFGQQLKPSDLRREFGLLLGGEEPPRKARAKPSKSGQFQGITPCGYHRFIPFRAGPMAPPFSQSIRVFRSADSPSSFTMSSAPPTSASNR